MMDLDDLFDQLEEAEAFLLEPRAVFDVALIGIADRAGGLRVAAYDTDKCIAALQKQNNWEYEDALEWFETNTLGSHVGDGTPVFIGLLEDDA